ncbi:uncharacterized protein EDB91DRAFT_1266837 [Suillus paluster]|uniref:uncharacterized protein n=1 Tax=Suillus paluster TaxID=48578 RepID=UPI001B86FB12|nr:uncharacterized protein EDB91DRAFT_1266837 [Suillus paluster]KAG1746580.1 hypothetical protein EDB91DRAFT_1266837 [Suillus paluster]
MKTISSSFQLQDSYPSSTRSHSSIEPGSHSSANMMLHFCPEVTTSSRALVSKAQTEIDNELVALEERMRALRMRRNSFSPISSIPPEILGAIFVHHAHQVQMLYAPDSHVVLSWLIVGHVCCYWREVALGTPELWATPFLNSSKGTEEMLMRSKMAPLILRTGQQYRIDCVQKTLIHIERLQEVSLMFSNGGMTHHCIVEFLNKLSSCSAPKLLSLSLEGAYTQAPQMAIPTTFLAPNLRKLQITRCNLSWASSVLTGLTVLDIKALPPQCLPTLDEFMSALRRMPALHTLALEDALPTLPVNTNSLPRVPRAMNVRLPHLKRLRLVAKMLEVANVLNRVELPNLAGLEIRLGCRVSSSGNATQEWNLSLSIISRLLDCYFKAESRQVPRSVRLSADGPIRLQCSTVRNPLSWVATSWVGSTSKAFLDMEWTAESPVILDFDFPRETSRTILYNLRRLVPLRSLEALYVEGHFPCWDGFWNDVTARGTARNLAYIYLRGNAPALEDLLKSLRSHKHSVSRSMGGHLRRGPIFSPALSHLVLDNLDFDQYTMTFLRPSDLRDVLMDRVNEGRGLDHLAMTVCTGVSAREVRLLREVVADVSWDEYDSDYDLEYDYDSLEDDDDDNYSFYSDGNYGGYY